MKNEEKLSYVQQQITNSLLGLMEHYPFEEITVTQIVQNAGVGRASFYRNYNSRKDVIQHYMMLLIKTWGKEFEAAGDPDWAGSLLKHYYKHKNFYLLLYRCGLSHYILIIIKEVVGVESESQNVPAYMKAWFAGALFGWIEEWIHRGMHETPEEMQALLETKIFG
ncbi:TetR/AcrR family transcriptional regulator [Paenibacillus sp. 32352]|uniref:TetR/AcrR family transcriptional regulator n=1 Tax=Paenibacillus sp. 32352 TaxID=1969111 RepID=UPI0009AC5D31|nr:TetR/AcrR family transcriptional regulator [Paenibacillus sp. 32352]